LKAKNKKVIGKYLAERERDHEREVIADAERGGDVIAADGAVDDEIPEVSATRHLISDRFKLMESTNNSPAAAAAEPQNFHDIFERFRNMERENLGKSSNKPTATSPFNKSPGVGVNRSNSKPSTTTSPNKDIGRRKSDVSDKDYISSKDVWMKKIGKNKAEPAEKGQSLTRGHSLDERTCSPSHPIRSYSHEQEGRSASRQGSVFIMTHIICCYII
jgi:hypothetical protein